MTAGDIVTKARRALGDSDATGWDDSTLIDYVDQAQKDLCKIARVYKKQWHLGIHSNAILYHLPTNCFQVDRVEYEDTALRVLSREDQDNRRYPRGLHIIKSDINMDSIELSEPIEATNYASFIRGSVLEEYADIVIDPELGVSVDTDIVGMSMDDSLGVVTGFISDPEVTGVTEEYGDISGSLLSDIALAPSDNLGVLTALDLGYNDESNKSSYGFLTSVNEYTVKGTYGICTDALAKSTHLEVYYSAIPTRVQSLYDALVVKDIWERALVHYVVGTARQDDNDEGNYQLGAAELNLYMIEVKKAIKLSARSYTSTVSEIKETQYRRL